MENILLNDYGSQSKCVINIAIIKNLTKQGSTISFPPPIFKFYKLFHPTDGNKVSVFWEPSSDSEKVRAYHHVLTQQTLLYDWVHKYHTSTPYNTDSLSLQVCNKAVEG